MNKLLCLTVLLLSAVVIQAEQVQIEQARPVPVGDSQFYVQFMYQSHDLSTEPMANTVSQQEMFANIGRRIKKYLEERADSNMVNLKKALEGKTVTINVP